MCGERRDPNEFEITLGMIEAGVDLFSRKWADYPGTLMRVREMVSDVYGAMAAYQKNHAEVDGDTL